jgi:hypothetical protein
MVTKQMPAYSVRGDEEVMMYPTDCTSADASPSCLQVKHRLGSSTVELFFLSALLPSAIIEHMPPSLFVTDLVQRNRYDIRRHTLGNCSRLARDKSDQ